MISEFIRVHTAARLFNADSLEQVPDSNLGLPLGQKMILVDTHDMTRDHLIGMLSSKA